jgi:hypothetical protein
VKILLLCLMFCFVALGSTSCAVDEGYRLADKATHNAIAPEYLDYVEDDESLDEDEKQSRRDTVATWRKRIDSWGD